MLGQEKDKNPELGTLRVLFITIMADILPSDALLSALQVDEILEQISKDDQEEWEYEYSTTETEV